MFSDLKKSVSKSFNKMQEGNLYFVEVDRDKIFQLYLDGFAEEYKQEHNCNCCKSFLRQFGGIVSIVNGKMVSLWDNLNPNEEYRQSVENLKKYIHSLPIHGVFFNTYSNCGTDRNLDQKRNVIWEHFFVKLERKFIKNDIPTVQARLSSTKSVFQRALNELTLESVDTVLELIDQNSLYRGKEFEPTLKEFRKLKKQYTKLSKKAKDLFCWAKVLEIHGTVTNIRNSSIGTLLIDLTDGMELDKAVSRFEKVVAPTNYKRPTALVTKGMVEDAKKKLEELGFLDSLERRFANSTDISVENVMYVDRSSEMNDVFDEISKETTVNPKKLSKVEEITVENFVEKVLPKAKSMEVLVENRHLNNFTSLITAKEESKSLFKWDNPFSWSYTGGITDSIKERVKAAGGSVTGVLRASLSWNNHDDLDIHCHEPKREHIYFGHKKSNTGGNLDVDMNAGSLSNTPVENITWPNIATMQEGEYTIKVYNYNQRATNNQGYTLQIEYNGEIFDFEESKNPRNQTYGLVVKFTWSRKDGIKFSQDVKSNVQSKDKWGVKTNTFVKVKQAMLSPNYWNGKVGNKHYMFILENCVSDEKPRPFFNEFLNQDLDKHRKVLEILGSKVKVEESDNQLSGLGFSETQKNSVIVRVNGSFKRTLKVIF